MAVRKTKKLNSNNQINTKVQIVEEKATDLGEDRLDPQEEKVLDWILKAIVIFVLGWLLLGILMAVGGLFGIWK